MLDEELGLGAQACESRPGPPVSRLAPSLPAHPASSPPHTWASAVAALDDFDLTPSPTSSSSTLPPSQLRQDLFGPARGSFPPGAADDGYSPAHSPSVSASGKQPHLEGEVADDAATRLLHGEERYLQLLDTAAAPGAPGQQQAQGCPAPPPPAAGAGAAPAAPHAGTGASASHPAGAAASAAPAAVSTSGRCLEQQQQQAVPAAAGAGGAAVAAAAARSPLQCLPREVLLRVVSFLSADDLTQSARACTLFARLTAEPALWRRLFAARWGKGRLPRLPRSWKVGGQLRCRCVEARARAPGRGRCLPCASCGSACSVGVGGWERHGHAARRQQPPCTGEACLTRTSDGPNAQGLTRSQCPGSDTVSMPRV
jgi:hypothetical protein